MSGRVAAAFAGRYRVVRRLGAGGSGAVFLAHDERLSRHVAVKRLHGVEVTAETAQRLRREARIMAALHHPGLVTVYDMLTDGDELLLVMEYVRGETLSEVLADAPLEWGRIAGPLDQVAAALDYVHEQGVVHRDLKPSNILVATSGRVKIADLGLATAAEITNVTPPGTIIGTPAYMAPEQARGVTCTRAVDVFALGTIVFQALAGRLPRSGPTVVAVLRQAEHDPPADLRDHRPETPPAAAEALMRAMSPRPAARQASAGELLEELHAAFRAQRRAQPAPPAETPAPAARVPPAVQRGAIAPPRRWRARAVALAALTLGLAAVVALLLVLRDTGSRAPRAAKPLVAASSATPATTARANPTPTATPTNEPAATATPTPTATPAASPTRLSPTATVRAFYRRAAAGDFAGAWRLASPGMRRAFGDSLDTFTRDLSSLRHIEFREVSVVGRDAGGVTVAIRSVATHVDHVDRCTGTLRAIRGTGGRWLVEPAGVQCTRG
jgi:eukaryotic-like serine/threonine-protein kinase